MKMQRMPRKGFSLVELLTVIAIIGILAAILIPAIGAGLKQAKQMKALANARQIAQAYNTFALEGGRPRTIVKGSWSNTNRDHANNAREWAAVLASYGYIKNASLYYIDDDPNYPLTEDITTVLDGTSINMPSDESSIAWSLVVQAPRPGGDSSQIPLVFTRGWQSGTNAQGIGNGWKDDSPWRGDGGHIAYMDAHVDWTSSTSEVGLVKLGTSDSTDDLFEAATGSGGGTNAPEVFNK